MFVVLGATGHVGSAVAEALLARGEAVTVVTREAARAERFRVLGAAVAIADLHDYDALREVFWRGTRAFLLNPPAAPQTHTDEVEKETVRHLLAALDGSGLEKVVAESTYGAQPGEHLGDLSTLYELERGLASQPIPHSVIRAGYYMSNWDMMVEPARSGGVLPTMYPADLKVPMVAPADLGDVAAGLLTDPTEDVGLHYVEGPARYSSGDVARAFARALGKSVNPVVTPRDQWEQTYLKLGFSEQAARSYSRMTAISVDGDYELPEAPVRGRVTLEEYVDTLVRENRAGCC